MTSEPLVSALICAYNAERFIAQTVRSVWAQSYRHIEIVVIDNASHDGTYEKLEGLRRESPMRMRIIKSDRNLGVAAGLNALLDVAHGEYAAILDHDDFWHCDKTRRQVEFLERHPQYPACGSQIYVWWEKTDRVSLFKAKEHDCVAYHLTLMFRLRRDLRYDASVGYRFDTHFTRNMLCAHGRRIFNLQEPLATWRMRADRGNLSRDWHSVAQLWSYWRHTGSHVETMKGLAKSLIPNDVFDAILRARHSISEHRIGDAELSGFPSPLGPADQRAANAALAGVARRQGCAVQDQGKTACRRT